MQELSLIFEEVDDPRRSNATRYDLCKMLMIGLRRVMRVAHLGATLADLYDLPI